MASATILLITSTHETAAVWVGEAVIVKLPDSATSGCRWQAEGADPAIVRLQTEDTLPGTAPGAAGVRRFEFLAVGIGQVTLRFKLRHLSEADMAPIRQSSVDLTVK